MMSPSQLLARDRFAVGLGATVADEDPDALLVEMEVRPQHLDRGGAVAPGVLFTVADCAMSLISNREQTAVAVAAHFAVAPGGCPGDVTIVAARIHPVTPMHDDAVTWHARVTGDGRVVAVFTATTLKLKG